MNRTEPDDDWDAKNHSLPLSGVRVIEVAEWVFVPTVGAMLADWGAEVIKVEHPERGDGFRGLVSHGVVPAKSGLNPSVELVNRGKRSIGVDLRSDASRELIHRLVNSSDAFITSLLPASLDRLGLGVDDLRAHNPALVYGRGHGFGVRGPDANAGAFDTTAFWARSGLADTFTQPGSDSPHLGRIAVGDRTSAAYLAFGVVAGLFKARATGAPSVVDVSLLASAMWTVAGDVAPALAVSNGEPGPDELAPSTPPPALIGGYRTSDDRFITLAIIQPSLHFGELCRRIGREDLLADHRFADAAGHATHADELRDELVSAFAAATYAEWCDRFVGADFPWSPVQKVQEVIADEQILANDYVGEVPDDSGSTFRTPSGPVQFDEAPPPLRRAPAHGADTDEVLAELGYSWDEIIELKIAGAVL